MEMGRCRRPGLLFLEETSLPLPWGLSGRESQKTKMLHHLIQGIRQRSRMKKGNVVHEPKEKEKLGVISFYTPSRGLISRWMIYPHDLGLLFCAWDLPYFPLFSHFENAISVLAAALAGSNKAAEVGAEATRDRHCIQRARGCEEEGTTKGKGSCTWSSHLCCPMWVWGFPGNRTINVQV